MFIFHGAESFLRSWLVLQLIKKFPAFYGKTRKFITVLTSARHLFLTWANSIQSPQTLPTSWRSILILSSHLLVSFHQVSPPKPCSALCYICCLMLSVIARCFRKILQDEFFERTVALFTLCYWVTDTDRQSSPYHEHQSEWKSEVWDKHRAATHGVVILVCEQ